MVGTDADEEADGNQGNTALLAYELKELDELKELEDGAWAQAEAERRVLGFEVTIAVWANAKLDEQALRLDELYPCEGVAGPAAGVLSWNERSDSAYESQLEKQLAIETACAAVEIDPSSGGGSCAGGSTRPSPRFAKAREGPR